MRSEKGKPVLVEAAKEADAHPISRPIRPLPRLPHHPHRSSPRLHRISPTDTFYYFNGSVLGTIKAT
ncbi:MAG: hypothetical protein K2N35_02750 [Muribaculaceae bacterium]|nr:hypothetical protein [Muribaculaceae bacterium]